ncbi:MAG: hypothetical protein RBQ99_02930 [Trichlorobacter sp.]|nr:hypothetical protein [Trichlorobacter sp.]
MMTGPDNTKGISSEYTTTQDRGQTHIIPHSLFEALAFVSQQYANERGGAETNSEMFTDMQKLDFLAVGWANAIKTLCIFLVTTPLALAGYQGHLPLFGGNRSYFDGLYCLMLALAFPIGVYFFFAKAGLRWYGDYTRTMVKRLITGASIATVILSSISFIFVQYMCFVFFSDERLASTVQWLADSYKLLFKITPDKTAGMVNWLIELKVPIIQGSWFFLISCLIFAALPWIAYLYRAGRNYIEADLGIYAGDKLYGKRLKEERFLPSIAKILHATGFGGD